MQSPSLTKSLSWQWQRYHSNAVVCSAVNTPRIAFVSCIMFRHVVSRKAQPAQIRSLVTIVNCGARPVKHAALCLLTRVGRCVEANTWLCCQRAFQIVLVSVSLPPPTSSSTTYTTAGTMARSTPKMPQTALVQLVGVKPLPIQASARGKDSGNKAVPTD